MSNTTRNLIVLIAGLGIIIATFLTPGIRSDSSQMSDTGSYQIGKAVMQKFENAGAGISFEYRVAPDGYTLTGDVEVRDDNSVSEYFFDLTQTQEHLSYLARMPGEGGPSISIRVYENKENLSPRLWAETHPMGSQYNLAYVPIEDTTVGGVPAVTYKRDGLHAGTVVVGSNNLKIYVIDGDMPDPNNPEEPIQKDFNKILESIKFF